MDVCQVDSDRMYGLSRAGEFITALTSTGARRGFAGDDIAARRFVFY